MSIEQEQRWMTGEEIGRENRRLIDAGVPDEAPEFQAFFDRIRARDDFLYEKFGKQYLDTHPNKWIAISLDGEVIIRDTASATIHEATDRFGAGNFAMRRLAEFPGHVFYR
jgi:hypothetical protein